MQALNIYKSTFNEYPDAMGVKDISSALGVSTKTVYGLMKKGSLPYVKIGREFRVSKVSLISFLRGKDKDGKK